jgi:NAD(P)-dependent dehydrogenase (short-subunit alcohol dehydrogenase family)
LKDLAGRVAVVTGAADGIGRALADTFAAAGARLVLADVDGAKVAAVAEALASSGTEVVAMATDVSRADDVAELRDAALAKFGAVHVLCNNAGVMGPVGDPLWELPIGEWERVLAVNLWGVLHGITAFLPAMLESGDEGHVLNTASMQGVTSGALIPEYTVSKHAVVALSEALRAQLTARGARIGVTVLCPGGVRTGLADKEERRLSSVGDGERWAQAPGSGGRTRNWGPMRTPADVARAALSAIREDRLYAFTNPGARARVEERLRPIIEALDVNEPRNH